MLRLLSYLGASLLVAMLASCGGANRSVTMHDTESSVWSEAEEFTYVNSDTLYRRDISITLRYDGGYVQESIPLTVLTISPDSMVLEEEFTLHVPRLADMRPDEHTFPYRKQALLRRSGEYRFRLTPKEPIEGVLSVGIIVDER